MTEHDHIGEGDRRDVTVHAPPARATAGTHHHVDLHDEVEMAGSVEMTLWRGVNANRLTLLGIVATIALTVAFGVNGVSWEWRTAIGVGTFVGVALACRLAFSSLRVGHLVMALAYWMLHEEPIEEKSGQKK